jgi:hypothetical protein
MVHALFQDVLVSLDIKTFEISLEIETKLINKIIGSFALELYSLRN